MKLGLLRQPQVFHGANKGIEIPFVKVRMKFESKCGLDIVLRLEMHLQTIQYGEIDGRKIDIR